MLAVPKDGRIGAFHGNGKIASNGAAVPTL
jgi:hypothetical protein